MQRPEATQGPLGVEGARTTTVGLGTGTRTVGLGSHTRSVGIGPVGSRADGA